ncbi:hypothetical protein FACS1894180_9540 [Bacteroidia bacterium]|nr:hypothetical protein FACS1894180_9540 [Bacteroidia bacterium]
MIYILSFSQEDKSNTLGSQLFKNFHINWTTYKTNDYKWNRFGFGSAYGQSFPFEKDLTWKVGMDIDWAKYTLNYTGNFDYVTQKSTMRATSVSIPLTVNYLAYSTFWTGIDVYTGPVYEQIIHLNTYNFFDPDLVSHAQFGWTIGSRFRFGAIFSIRLAYVHYFTGMFVNGDMTRSGVRFSVGF